MSAAGEKEEQGEEQLLDRVLAEPVSVDGSYKPFARMTAAEVAGRAEEIGGISELGQAPRIAAVAAAWKGLAEAMRAQPAATVGELDREALRARADRLGVLPPGGSFL